MGVVKCLANEGGVRGKRSRQASVVAAAARLLAPSAETGARTWVLLLLLLFRYARAEGPWPRTDRSSGALPTLRLGWAGGGEVPVRFDPASFFLLLL